MSTVRASVRCRPIGETVVKSITAKDGVPIVPAKGLWYEECCDCGLTHKTVYRIVRGKVQVTFWRADKETEEARKNIRMSFVRGGRGRRTK